MKTISVRDLQKRLRDCVNASPRDRVVVTRHGTPSALVLQTTPSFWRLIAQRRKEPTISLDDMRRILKTKSK